MAELKSFKRGESSEVHGALADEIADWVDTGTIEGAKIVVNGYRLTNSQHNVDENGNPAKKAIIDVQYAEGEDKNNYGWSTESKTILRQLSEQEFPFLTAIESVPLKRNPKWSTLTFTEV